MFDKVEEFFENARNDVELNRKLKEDRIVFFLHLLGTDTIGHSKRPYSDAYLKNIVLVDKGVKKIVDIINDYYNDTDTAFIFASDHGMSDKGACTPFVLISCSLCDHKVNSTNMSF